MRQNTQLKIIAPEIYSYLFHLCYCWLLFASFVELTQLLALKIINILLDCTNMEVIAKDQISLWD